MSTPRNRSVVNEIQSAVSALHMEPEPLPGPFDDEEMPFLAYRDRWVAHAVEHLHAALMLAIDVVLMGKVRRSENLTPERARRGKTP